LRNLLQSTIKYFVCVIYEAGLA